MASTHKQIEMLPPAVIQLQREIVLHHPTLMRVLALMDDPEQRFEAIAVHCDIKLDGEYTQDQIAFVADVMIPRLMLLREPPPSESAPPQVILPIQ